MEWKQTVKNIRTTTEGTAGFQISIICDGPLTKMSMIYNIQKPHEADKYFLINRTAKNRAAGTYYFSYSNPSFFKK